MQDTPLSQSTRKRLFHHSFRRSTIRAQFIFAFGLILLLATVIAIIGYMSLWSLQEVVRTNLQDANQIRALSLDIQTEFFMARQNESHLLVTWRTTGFGVEASRDVTANENDIASARSLLDQMEQLVKNSNDASLRTLTEEISDLRPLLDAYSTAFQVTVNNLRDRSRSGGLEDQINSELDILDTALAATPIDQMSLLLARVRANKEAYLLNKQRKDLDAFTSNINTLMNEIRNADPGTLQPSGISKSDMIVHAETILFTFNKIVDLEQSSLVNASLLQSVNDKITQSTARIGMKSDAGLNHAKTRLDTINRQTTLTLSLTAILALAFGVLAAFFLGRGIIQPIRQLSLAAGRMGQGHLDQHVKVAGSAELYNLAEAFNSMAAQLSQMMTGLEQRVAERTHDLERRSDQLKVAAEVARDATSIRELDILLDRAVHLIRDRYGFYHAGIFLRDSKGEYAILQAATGDAGRIMLQRNHKLKIGEMGIVGYVCSTGQPRISLDVGSDAVHFKNPLLPETRSEMALPLKIADRVIGALDVQSTEEAAFDQDDITVLQTMADQLAIAIENARLFQEAQENLQQLRALYGRYSEEAWGHLAEASKVNGYQYDAKGVTPLLRKVGNGNEQAQEEEPPTIHIPLKLRGQEIATLQVWTESGTTTYIDRALLESIAERISQAMESARLYEEARSLARNEQILSHVTAQFTRSFGLDALLQTAVQELGQLPNVTDVTIHLGFPENISS